MMHNPASKPPREQHLMHLDDICSGPSLPLQAISAGAAICTGGPHHAAVDLLIAEQVEERARPVLVHPRLLCGHAWCPRKTTPLGSSGPAPDELTVCSPTK